MAIRSFRHKGLAVFWTQGKSKGVGPDLAKRVKRCLQVLAAATILNDVRVVPSLRLHLLKGTKPERWAIDVNGPWRITFEWTDAAENVDLEQYH